MKADAKDTTINKDITRKASLNGLFFTGIGVDSR